MARSTLVVRVTFKVDVDGDTPADRIAAARKAGEDTIHPTNPSLEPESVEVATDPAAPPPRGPAWVAIPIGDHKGRVEQVYGPFWSELAAQVAAAQLSSDPTECQAVPLEKPEWLIERILAKAPPCG